MLFNSFEYTLFLPLVFLTYWFVVNKHLRLQNIFLIFVSYIFYGWWDWRFLILIAFTSAASFYSGILIEKYRARPDGRKKAKTVSAANIVINLLILCVFKYFNFFSENLFALFAFFGFKADWFTINVLLPVGISFYTFQALSYTIDVYKGKIGATRDAVSFFAFISFFPQLVAGPIERATNLLPQFYVKRRFDYGKAVDGMRQILWGLFKKMVIADNCSRMADMIFNNYQDASASTLVFGSVLFAFQIYGDFSGYSDIAIGTARLFGINLMRNFNFPYFSRDIAEFWRRWHISLSTWFRDYIYIPLGGSRGTKWDSLRNTMIIFVVSGFWHGADWTFIVWGAYHGLLFAPLLLTNKNRKYTGEVVAGNRLLPSLREIGQMVLTFILVLIGWIIFRADSIADAAGYLAGIFDRSILSMPVIGAKKTIFFIVLFLAVEWLGRRNEFAIQRVFPKSRILRWTVYLLLVISIVAFSGQQSSFIYFQF